MAAEDAKPRPPVNNTASSFPATPLSSSIGDKQHGYQETEGRRERHPVEDPQAESLGQIQVEEAGHCRTRDGPGGAVHSQGRRYDDFVRLHPNEDEYWSDEMCFVSVPIKGEKKDRLHIIDEELALRYLPNKKIRRFRLALATKPYDAWFLCMVPSVHLDNQWNNDALKACHQATTHWIQVSSRKEESPGREGYKIDKAKDVDAFPEPKWPSQTLEELIELSFNGAMIETEDDPSLHRLIGARQKMS